MQGRILRMVLVVAAALSTAACSVTRHIPQGSYLLTKNTVVTDRTAPKNERITADDVEKYIQQSPNKRFLGTNLTLWIYSMTDPESKTRWSRLLRSMGTAPVILDTTLVQISTDYLGKYLYSRGYFDGRATYALDTAKKRAEVIYTLTQGEPYRVGKVAYRFEDKALKTFVLRDTAATLIRPGMPFDFEVCNRERTRIKDYLQDRGYHNFTVNNVAFQADTIGRGHTVDVTIQIKQFLSGYAEDGSPLMDNNPIYRINRINVYPDYDLTRAAADTAYLGHPDTLEYRGLHIIYKNKLRVKKEVLRQAINLYPNYLYSAADVSQTYSNLMNLGYYRSARIGFADAPDATRNLVTFIGEADEAPQQTSEQYLIYNIYCTPSLRQAYNIGLEATFTSDYYGLSATVGYRNRSLFRGVEMFDASVTGSYDFMRVKGKSASFEFGGTTSITFPRFVLPFQSHALSKLPGKHSRLELSVSGQRRPYYHRVLSNANWGYSWSGNKYTNFTLRPIEIGVVKVNYLDSTFIESLQNKYLINSYKSQLVAGISASWAYNNASRNARGNSLGIRLNVETMGNLLNGMYNLFGSKPAGKDYYELLGIQFAQYVRADLAVANSIPVGGKMSLVYRLYGGAGITYGNSRGVTLPYDRLFYSGGSNSMRGWAARTLGPGNELRDLSDTASIYPSQQGNMRLEANLEVRFPVWSILRGAIFVDAGNVWLMGPGEYTEETIFRFNNFYKQLGVNTGIGLRVDISMAVLRLDWGIRLHDPDLPSGSRWIHNFKLKNTALSVAVGYPF